ncbi:hypothetical protein [Staphylococcus aureus]|uniref:hypothetical protein n=1 Tax=Staphylococcus aureus TaxID=1280 RepID=UPI00077DF46A|nr:hypothetical protein [Staphylococcus aureus]
MAVVRGGSSEGIYLGVFRCSIYYVTNYSIDEQGVQCIFTILQLMNLIILELSILENDLIVEL